VPLGGSEATIRLEATPAVAFQRARAALERVGKLKEADEAAGFLRGSGRYGLQKIRLKITVTGEGDGSAVLIRAQGDDVWSAGAKKVIRRVTDAIDGSSR